MISLNAAEAFKTVSSKMARFASPAWFTAMPSGYETPPGVKHTLQGLCIRVKLLHEANGTRPKAFKVPVTFCEIGFRLSWCFGQCQMCGPLWGLPWALLKILSLALFMHFPFSLWLAAWEGKKICCLSICNC